MLRAFIAFGLGLLLAGCWYSEERIFGDGDWAQLDLNGAYTSVDANGDEQARVVLETQRSGLVEGIGTDLEDGSVERSVLGFVRIEGGSGRYFLTVDRSEPASADELYAIAHLTEGGTLEFYLPDCAGTPPVDGLTIERDGFVDSDVCAFSSKSALMKAGLEAERFLSAEHIIAVSPIGRLLPDNGADDIVE
jgi:hypothetical protein